MKQALKKKDFTRNSVSSIKEKLNMTLNTADDIIKSSAEKETEFIPMPDAYVEATKLPGIPMGYLTLITGWSNTGKSTIKNCLIASCQRKGILPIIFETEGNFDWKYAMDCGVKAEPIYGDVEVEDVDEETGEVSSHTERQIINYDGDFIFYDSKILAYNYGDNDYSSGKKVSKKRKVAVIEDIAACINQILDMQDNDEIQQPVAFIWDSIGSIGSYKSYTSQTGNNMFDAGAIAQAFNYIINNRIPSSRKISEPYTNSFICVNKIWNDSMNSMGGVPSIELKGGKTMMYGARLVIHLGGIGKASTKKLEATAKGQKYQYGITTKIRVTKNQLPTPFNITYEGELSCVHNGLLSPDRLDEYKKEHMKDILKKLESLGAENVNEKDVNFKEDETNE